MKKVVIVLLLLAAVVAAVLVYYTLGKLQILKLRADMESRQGKAFNLEQFHDAFMQHGFAPIKIVRRAMLGDESPTL